MAELVKPWNDGGSLSVSYDGDRDGSAVFSSDTYEGIDREMEVRFVGGGASLVRKVRQEGKRQQFRTKDGLVFRCADGGRFGVLKADKPYTKVEYLESTRTQWIDTGILTTTTTDYEFIGSITEDTITCWIAGAPTWCGIHKKANTVAATQWSNGMTYVPVEVEEVFKISVRGNKAYFNDVETNSLTRRNATMSLFLFAYHHTNNTGTISSSIRMYSFKIWDNGALVRDFIPVLDKDGVACMYDKVSGEFFYNQGTGDFIAGNIK